MLYDATHAIADNSSVFPNCCVVLQYPLDMQYNATGDTATTRTTGHMAETPFDKFPKVESTFK